MVNLAPYIAARVDRVTRGLTLMCSLGPYDEGTLVCLLYTFIKVEEYGNPEKHEFARRSWPLDCNLESVSDDSSYKPSPLSTPRCDPDLGWDLLGDVRLVHHGINPILPKIEQLLRRMCYSYV